MTTLLLRIESVVSLLFTLGHTMGWPQEVVNAAADAPAGVEIDEWDGFQRIPRGEPRRGNAGGQ